MRKSVSNEQQWVWVTHPTDKSAGISADYQLIISGYPLVLSAGILGLINQLVLSADTRWYFPLINQLVLSADIICRYQLIFSADIRWHFPLINQLVLSADIICRYQLVFSADISRYFSADIC